MRAIKQITPRLDATIIAREVSSMLWSNYFLNKFTYRVFHNIPFSVHIIESFLWFFTEIFHNRSIFFGYIFIFFFEWRYPAKKRCFLIQLKLKHWRFSFTVKNMLKITKLKIDWQKLFSYLSLLKPIEKRLRRR